MHKGNIKERLSLDNAINLVTCGYAKYFRFTNGIVGVSYTMLNRDIVSALNLNSAHRYRGFSQEHYWAIANEVWHAHR